MKNGLENLVDQLADGSTRQAARAELIRRGAASVEPLLAALQQVPDPEHRKDIMRILAELSDPRAAETFRKHLHSDDETLRAISARGLARVGAPDALAACVAAINDAPDPLHFEMTPAVISLSEMGLPAMKAVLPLLDSADDRTRQRAQKALELATFKEISHTLKPRPLSDVARAEWTALWRRNGSYQWNAPAEQRRAAIRHWEEWIENRLKD